MIRDLSSLARAGRYRHGPVTQRELPKASGAGTRTIVLQNLPDRVMSRAITQVIAPLLDATLDAASCCRPGRGARFALASALTMAEQQRRFVWVAADIRDAFPSVPVKQLGQILRSRLPASDVCDLTEQIINGHRGQGLAQGSAISQFLLNLYLDHLLDRKWRQWRPEVPLIRYVDDILLLCASREEADEAHRDLVQLIRDARMRLKGETDQAIHDLERGDRVDWLGYRIRMGREEMLEVLPQLDEEPGHTWDRLQRSLTELHFRPGAPMLVWPVVHGKFIQYAAPCYPHVGVYDVYNRISSIARECGFEEFPGFSDFDASWRSAHKLWLSYKAAFTDD